MPYKCEILLFNYCYNNNKKSFFIKMSKISPTMSSISDIVHNDAIRYSQKGLGIIVGFIMILFYFLYFPHIVKQYLWSYVLMLKNINFMYFLTFYLVHEFTFIVGNFLLLYLLYSKKLGFLEKYRISPNRPWPWEEDSVKWKIVFKKTMKSLLWAHLFIIPLITGLEAYIGVAFKVSKEEWPSTQEIILQILFFMICEDFTFYYGHRTLHSKYLYPKIHKIHHEYNNPIALSSEYAHPIELVLVNMLPNAVGSKILGAKVHLVTYVLWLIIRVFETLDGHSGYEFPWSPFRLLPMSASAQYHNYHHTHNDGNYGSFFMIWDTLLGTNKYYFKYLANAEKKE